MRMVKHPSILKLIALFALGIGLFWLVPVHSVARADTPTPTETPISTTAATFMPTADTPTATASLTPTSDGSPTATSSPTPTPNGSPTATASISPTLAGSPTAAILLTPTPTGTPQAKPRVKTVSEVYNGYLWWLVNYHGNHVLCQFSIDHIGLPTRSEVWLGCGDAIYQEYITTQPCGLVSIQDKNQLCEGVYLYFVKYFVGKRNKDITYPGPTALISLTGCAPAGQTNLCKQSPGLLISGIEPMDGESIVSVEGNINDVSFRCNANPCVAQLPVTGSQGVRAEFWVNSSFGDSSKHYTALVRVTPATGSDASSNTGAQQWLADVASSQLQGTPSYSCSQVWESLPDAAGLPDWLSSPTQFELMQTNTQFYFLAGALINTRQVDVSGCPNGGMQTPLIPNTCGELRALPLVTAWQNQFDQAIIDVAHQSNMPALLMKDIFSRESQFWPGVYSNDNEVGLGQMTDGGADTLFTWNPTFFKEYCGGVFDQEECAKGYYSLPNDEKNLIRGALMGQLNASCANCMSKINLGQARFSIDVFASSLEANCEQAGQIVYNTTGKAAGISSSYNDLWKFTLTNYNAGPGCLQSAIAQTNASGKTLNWENVSSNLSKSCQGATSYVNDIMKIKLFKPNNNSSTSVIDLNLPPTTVPSP